MGYKAYGALTLSLSHGARELLLHPSPCNLAIEKLWQGFPRPVGE